jgi:hypothetical protein
VSGAFLASLTYVVLSQVWFNGLGLFAGMGIILIGRAAGGILGIEALQFQLPWVKRSVTGAEGVTAGRQGAIPAIGGETRAAG